MHFKSHFISLLLYFQSWQMEKISNTRNFSVDELIFEDQSSTENMKCVLCLTFFHLFYAVRIKAKSSLFNQIVSFHSQHSILIRFNLVKKQPLLVFAPGITSHGPIFNFYQNCIHNCIPSSTNTYISNWNQTNFCKIINFVQSRAQLTFILI